MDLHDVLLYKGIFGGSGGGGGGGQNLPFGVFAVPGNTGVDYKEGDHRMYKVSDNIPTITEDDCGCFVAFNGHSMVSTYIVPLVYDENGVEREKKGVY